MSFEEDLKRGVMGKKRQENEGRGYFQGNNETCLLLPATIHIAEATATKQISNFEIFNCPTGRFSTKSNLKSEDLVAYPYIVFFSSLFVISDGGDGAVSDLNVED